MLLCDMLMEQSGKVTPWELAEPVGKAASKLLLAMPSEIKKEKKRALRRKLNVAAVESEVRGRAINLPMPSAKECEAVRRAASRAIRVSLTAPTPTPVPDGKPTPAPSLSLPAPPVAPPPPAPCCQKKWSGLLIASRSKESGAFHQTHRCRGMRHARSDR